MNLAEHLANLKATREEKSKRMKELHAVSVAEGRSMNTAESEEFDTLEGELKTLDKDIERTQLMKGIEDAEKSTATPVDDKGKRTAPASATGIRTTTAKDTSKLPQGMAFARLARVKALAHLGMVNGERNQVAVAKMVYPDDELLVQTIEKTAVAAANTLAASGTWAGNLINEGGAAFADFVEYLRPRSLMGQISDRLRRIPFDTPVLIQGSAGTGKWVKEGTNKPLTQWTYTRTKLTPLKVAAIAAATKETLMRASVAADTLLRDELARAIGARIDTTFMSDDAAVSEESPAGILLGGTEVDVTDASTVAEIRCDIASFLTAMSDANLSLANTFWVMPERIAIALSLIVNEVGASAFPGVTPTGGTLAGLPVFVTGYSQPDSDGSSLVALIKGDEIFLGDEGGIQVSMSDQATLIMDDTPTGNITTPTGFNASGQNVVNLWQTNSVAFLVERFINFQKRRNQAVAWALVNWSACP